MSTVFKALADPTRRRILELLRRGPLSAGELSDEFPVSRPTMSAHFSVLREAGLVDAHKDGRTVIYRLRMSVLEEVLMGFARNLGLGAEKDEAVTAGSDVPDRPSGPAVHPPTPKEAP
jgi:DNA-binding transcriptional ArsR family regulator